MRIYAISDLHLPGGDNKPMDVFGKHWKDHYESIKQFWRENITEDDHILHCGDFCWAMHLEDAVPELNEFAKLPGKKYLIRGNHDLWWSSLAKMRPLVDDSITFIQNSSVVINDDENQRSIIICGTRGWAVPGSADFTQHDVKIYAREVNRLKLSLGSVKQVEAQCKYESRELITMLHYPPIPMYGVAFENDTEMNSVLREYGVTTVVFGHIHRPQQVNSIKFERDGIKYYLSSCDMIANMPVTVL